MVKLAGFVDDKSTVETNILFSVYVTPILPFASFSTGQTRRCLGRVDHAYALLKVTTAVGLCLLFYLEKNKNSLSHLTRLEIFKVQKP